MGNLKQVSTFFKKKNNATYWNRFNCSIERAPSNDTRKAVVFIQVSKNCLHVLGYLRKASWHVRFYVGEVVGECSVERELRGGRRSDTSRVDCWIKF